MKKLTKNQVKIIQKIFEETNKSDSEIGSLFDVSRNQINHIRHGYRWSDITGIKYNPTKKVKKKSDTPKEEKKTLFNYDWEYSYPRHKTSEDIKEYKRKFGMGGYQKQPVKSKTELKAELLNKISELLDMYL